MSMTIGIVCEGPTDFLAISELIDHATGEENFFRQIQPEQDLKGVYGNGWKGVYHWCECNNDRLNYILDGIYPKIDLLIIHMDADVARKEKAIHCNCEDKCGFRSEAVGIFDCAALRNNNCPICLPCNHHDDGIKGFKNHIKQTIKGLLADGDAERVIVVAPCDSTDSWIVAAYDDINQVEKINDPWNAVIASGKYYHGIRIAGKKKSQKIYRELLEGMDGKWDQVYERCEEAKALRDGLTFKS